MANQPEVRWSSRAIRDLDKIIEYLRTNWTEKEVKNFSDKLNKAIGLISKRPKLFRLTSFRNNLRRCVLSRQTTIYYQEIKNVIYIVSLFDNRRNPSKRP
jgi:plasmid stabilization system protein ParE